MGHWDGFKGEAWKKKVNVRDFIQANYTEYRGDDSFLEPIAPSTDKLWTKLQELLKFNMKKMAYTTWIVIFPATITSHEPGYLIKEEEKIVGLQTDVPLKQAFMPFGGIKMANNALTSNGYETDEEMTKIFTDWRKHITKVFSMLTHRNASARRNKIITGLPDAYGRGRIIGDYRRIALYGIDFLMEQKPKIMLTLGNKVMTDDVIRLREEITEQYRALAQMKEMATSYGFDISRPTENAKEAIQWLYFGYLAAIKSQNGVCNVYRTYLKDS